MQLFDLRSLLVFSHCCPFFSAQSSRYALPTEIFLLVTSTVEEEWGDFLADFHRRASHLFDGYTTEIDEHLCLFKSTDEIFSVEREKQSAHASRLFVVDERKVRGIRMESIGV